jgi:hypothetical protein
MPSVAYVNIRTANVFECNSAVLEEDRALMPKM